MTTTKLSSIALAAVLAIALMMGFVQFAQAAPARSNGSSQMTLVADNPETSTNTLPATGGTIRATVKYQGLVAGQAYELNVQVKDLGNQNGWQDLLLENVGSLNPDSASGTKLVHLRLNKEELKGHTIAVVGSIKDSSGTVVADASDVFNPAQQMTYGVDSADSGSWLEADSPGAGSSSGKAWAIAAGVVTAVVVGAVAIIAGVKRVIDRVKNHR